MESPLLNAHNKAEYEPAHTCEHILNRTMVNMFGCPRSRNAHVERKKSKCDYLLESCPTEEQVSAIEEKVNEVIASNLPVTIEFMDKIIEAGVTVFKIEGRARSAEYVRKCANCYRRAADAVCDGTYTPELAAGLKTELSEVFNRGFWDGYYQGARLGEWSEVYGSKATRKKVYSGKVTNWFAKLGVVEILVESASLHQGDEILIQGPSTGSIQTTVCEIRVDLKPVPEAGKGVYCSIPVSAEALASAVDPEGQSSPTEKLRRADKVYIWATEE